MLRSLTTSWRLVTTAALLVFSLGGRAPAVSAATLPHPAAVGPAALGYVPGVLLVGLDASTALAADARGQATVAAAGPSELAAALASLRIQTFKPVFAASANRAATLAGLAQPQRLDRVYRLHLPPGLTVARAAAILGATPGVLYAEPDYTAQLAAVPTDPLYAGQWGLTQIGAPAAWNVVTGTASAIVAVIDSGLDTSHIDLSPQLWNNPGEIPANSLDDDNNGLVDDVHGWNLLNHNANLTDSTGHGTQVAGVIAAAANNGQGVAGLCWGCRLMVVKVTNSSTANYSDIAAGVNYAVQKGARVINLSLGGPSDSFTLRAAIAAAVGQAVVVGGAGNDNSSQPFYPAAYPGVLAVAGTTPANTRTSLSNYGNWVDVAAPGEAITTTFSGGGYGSSSGTSLAAPFAAGLAGLLRSQHPTWTAAQVQAQIIHTADALADPGLGAGLLNAAAAVTASPQPLVSVAAVSANGLPNGHPAPGTAVDLLVTLYNDWGALTNVQGTLAASSPHVSLTTSTAAFGDLGAYANQANLTAFKFNLAGGAGLGTVLPFSLTLTADGGFAATLALSLTTELSTTNVSGSLTSRTWTADHTYVITGNTTVAAGQVLTIAPGTTVRVGPNLSLIVAGTLIAAGTAEQPIRFERQGSSGTWNRLYFMDSSQDAVLDGAGVYLSGSIVRHVILDAHSANGIELSFASPYLAENQLGSGGVHGVGDAANTLRVVGNVLTGAGINLSQVGWVLSNTVSLADTGIMAGANTTPTIVSGNRLLDNARGMNASHSVVVNNLFSHNDVNLEVSHPTVVIISNTLLYAGQVGILFQNGPAAFSGNNLVGAGEYLVRNHTGGFSAAGNWWGTTDTAAIEAAIFDDDEDGSYGPVDFAGFLTGPSADAPAYATGVAIAPDSVLGIQTGTFDFTFSRPMDQNHAPELVFDSTLLNHSGVYSTTNSGLPSNVVRALALDSDQNLWVATPSGLSKRTAGGVWTTFTTSNSGLPSNDIVAMSADAVGNRWLGLNNNGLARFASDGSWTHYTNLNSYLLCAQVDAIAIDQLGNVWIGCPGVVSVLSPNGDWSDYRASTSGLDGQQGTRIYIDSANNKWFGEYGQGVGAGVSQLDTQNNWINYTTSNSGLAADFVSAIVEDLAGNMWFGTWNDGVSVLSPTGTWTTYNQANTGLPIDHVRNLAVDAHGAVWIVTDDLVIAYPDGTWESFPWADGYLPLSANGAIAIEPSGSAWLGLAAQSNQPGLAYFHRNGGYAVNGSAQWLNATTWRATSDFTSLFPRDNYALNLTGALGADGVEIAPDTRFTFTVDYAGTISDQTPPPAPAVFANGVANNAAAVVAFWHSQDGDSGILLYRYAVGTTPGNADIINWTTTGAAVATRTGLGLTPGQTYWVSVQAQNTGGLWSPVASNAFVAGVEKDLTTYLPSVSR